MKQTESRRNSVSISLKEYVPDDEEDFQFTT